MKFLSKNADSEVLKKGLVYGKNRPIQNKEIRDLLVAEQKNFCAYTEKYISGLDSVEVEHFNSSKKYNDDYYNYYAVIRKANTYKKDEKYRDAQFFESLFFQKHFDKRIQFVAEAQDYKEIDAEDTEAKDYIAKGLFYAVIDAGDTEARDFINFIGLNNPDLSSDRWRHINRLAGLFNSTLEMAAYLKNHKEELSFITAIENKFNIDLSEFYQ